MFRFPLAAHAVYRGFSKHHRPFVDLICPLNCRKFTTLAESAQGGFEKKVEKILGPEGGPFAGPFAGVKALCAPARAEGEASGEPVVRARGRALQNRGAPGMCGALASRRQSRLRFHALPMVGRLRPALRPMAGHWLRHWLCAQPFCRARPVRAPLAGECSRTWQSAPQRRARPGARR